MLLCGDIPGTYRGECLCDIEYQQWIIKTERQVPQLEAASANSDLQPPLLEDKPPTLRSGSKVADLRIEDSPESSERKLQ